MKRININRIKLTPYEKRLEAMADEYVPVPKEEFEAIKRLIDRHKKDAVLNISINQGDLDNLKRKATKLGVKYQTFITELLHRIAAS